MNCNPIAQRGISNSRLVLGCMGFGADQDGSSRAAIAAAAAAFDTALEAGITLFDHADIYCGGRGESLFGEWLKARPGLRDQIVIQSKCGIRPGRYDFSRAHILESVDGILRRLGTDYLDILALHRPDPLMEAEEVAEAFAELQVSGKVRHFGVSNMHAAHMRYLQHALPEPLVVNQLEMSLGRLDWIDQGVHVNQSAAAGARFPEGLLEYCRMEGVQLQAWGPLSQGLFSGGSLHGAPEHIRMTADGVSALAREKETTPEAVVLGWLMKHPARIQPVIGTTQPGRIAACRDAARVAEQLSRDDWYRLYILARGAPLP